MTKDTKKSRARAVSSLPLRHPRPMPASPVTLSCPELTRFRDSPAGIDHALLCTERRMSYAFRQRAHVSWPHRLTFAYMVLRLLVDPGASCSFGY